MDIPSELIHIADTSTDTVPNATGSGGSVNTDTNGAAVMDACTTIRRRLAPFKEANPEGGWVHWVGAAYAERVSLLATGKYDTSTNTCDALNLTGNWSEYK